MLFALWVVFVLFSAYFSVTSFDTPPSQTAAILALCVFVVALFIAYLVKFGRRRSAEKLEGNPDTGDRT
jgi:membrane protein DedA with SNARE-associated domain